MLQLVLSFLDYALLTMPLTGLALCAFLKWRGVPKDLNLYISFGILPFPLLLITYVLSALIVNGPYGRFDLLRYVELCVQAFPFHVALFGIALILLRRKVSSRIFITFLVAIYLCAALWQFWDPYS